MCGLVGCAGTITKFDAMAFNNLLTVDSIRGKDGTGVAAVRQGKPEDVTVIKGPGGPDYLMDRSGYTRALNQNNMVLLGHNRYRTMGDNSARNTHPFEFKHIVGAHNGTMLKGQFKDGFDFDTDSEALFHNMNELGIEDTVKKLNGAYALTWWDKRDHSLNMLRNDKRDLYYVVDKTNSVLYWASEITFLYAVLNHDHIPFEGKKISMLPVDTHIKWTVNLKSNYQLLKPERVKRIPPIPLVTATGGEHHGGSGRKFREARGEVIVLGDTSKSKPNKEFFGERLGDQFMNRMHISLDGSQYYTGYYSNDVYNQEAFDEYTHEGCANCGSQPQFGEPIKFLRDNTFLCADCVLTNPDNLLDTIRELM